MATTKKTTTKATTTKKTPIKKEAVKKTKTVNKEVDPKQYIADCLAQHDEDTRRYIDEKFQSIIEYIKSTTVSNNDTDRSVCDDSTTSSTVSNTSSCDSNTDDDFDIMDVICTLEKNIKSFIEINSTKLADIVQNLMEVQEERMIDFIRDELKREY